MNLTISRINETYMKTNTLRMIDQYKCIWHAVTLNHNAWKKKTFDPQILDI